ncbi:signal peptidase II [Mucilaginibacter pallidiroseus]|uniref:Lipoprotein signal peptidase n=1 Tax=Mucilaginibacter pallidiroseus TaxID=2599295 RepID=A0A563U7Z0_9SPHI|nr:signal peptidase II [Mucilaginibacter pallidiroseus]TWR27448.1 signal peptidase II [Mucilaginibacter pallidiroseus]
MKLKGTSRTVFILLFLAFNFGCDQVSKTIVRTKLDYYYHHTFLDNHFALYKVENGGAFLSFGGTLPQPIRIFLLMVIPALALVGGLIYIIKNDKFSMLTLTGIVACIGGGMGNLYDRIVYNTVTDFMYIRFSSSLQTGVFNLADVSIMVGVGLMLLDIFLTRNDDKQAEASA